MVPQSSIPRRSLLKSASLGAISPLLVPLVSRIEAASVGIKPMRVVFFIEGNGLAPSHIQPVGIQRKTAMVIPGVTRPMPSNDTLIDMPLSSPGVSLPEPIAPLAKHVNRLTIVQGLSGRICGGGHSNGFGALGCYPVQSGPKDITIDVALARANPAIHQHVALGMNTAIDRDDAPAITYCHSASAPNIKVPHFQSARLAHKVLFGKILGGKLEAKVGAQGMILDHLAEDIGRLVRELPGEEAQRVQQFADAFSEIGRRQARLGEVDPAKIPPLRDALYSSKLPADRLEAYVDLAATALITGLTNTVTIVTGDTYPAWKGLADRDGHELAHACGNLDYAEEWHNGPTKDEAILKHRAMRVKIRQVHAQQVAALIDRLEAIPEGDGTMMDNTLIVHLSESAEEHHSFCGEWPMMLVGDLGGRLKLGNRFLNAPAYQSKGHATVAQLYTALLHAAGAPVDHFGMKDRVLENSGFKQDGPWTEVLA